MITTLSCVLGDITRPQAQHVPVHLKRYAGYRLGKDICDHLACRAVLDLKSSLSSFVHEMPPGKNPKNPAGRGGRRAHSLRFARKRRLLDASPATSPPKKWLLKKSTNALASRAMLNSGPATEGTASPPRPVRAAAVAVPGPTPLRSEEKVKSTPSASCAQIPPDMFPEPMLSSHALLLLAKWHPPLLILPLLCGFPEWKRS